MASMKLIITPAVTLANNETVCPVDHCECQILGTRVCIDNVNLCDGVANCGTDGIPLIYHRTSFILKESKQARSPDDIYDEDRYICKRDSKFQEVFLIALTFSAVILIALYMVHYWLRRCVSKVSQAFFVYTDTSENTLYLDTIMKSPTTDDDPGKPEDLGDLDFDFICDDIQKPPVQITFMKRLFGKCINFILCTNKISADVKVVDKDTKEKGHYSFTQMELLKMSATNTKDVNTQTGESLILSPNFIKNIKSHKYSKQKMQLKEYESKDSVKITIEKNISEIDELSLLRLYKNSSSIYRNKHSFSKRRLATADEDEKEIKSTVYDPPNTKRVVKNTSDQVLHGRDGSESMEKHLRFNENPTTIPDEDSEIERIGETPSFSGNPACSKTKGSDGGIKKKELAKNRKPNKNKKVKKITNLALR